MGEPLLLLEAASAYRGDLEDRLTEIFGAALHMHVGFCRRVVHECGTTVAAATFDVRTQQVFDGQRRLVDVVIWCYDPDGRPAATIFLENKYNPRRSAETHWFSEDQASRQSKALRSQPGEKHLVGIASRIDLRARDVPWQYEKTLSWESLAQMAYIEGGDENWEIDARLPSARASHRVLLEFWNYLKGGTVGALDDDDLLVLGHAVRTEGRLTRLLQEVAEQLDEDWDDDVLGDWETPGDAQITYVVVNPAKETWLAARDDGVLYVFIAGAEWDDESSVGDPTVYAGCGWGANKEEREAVKNSAWWKQVAGSAFTPVADKQGVYALRRRPLHEFVRPKTTLVDQAEAIAEWARPIHESAQRLPEPPEIATKQRRRGHHAR